MKRDGITMPDRKYLTQDEINVLLVRDFGRDDNIIIQIGLSTGIRASEMVNILVRNVSLDNIKIWDEKKDIFRIVTIDVGLGATLRSYIDAHYRAKRGVIKRHQKLFNFTTKTLNRKVAKWFGESNISAPARWHTFRHTYIRTMLDIGGERAIQFICLQTGDSPVTILKYYAVPSFDARVGMSNLLFSHYYEQLQPMGADE